MLDWKKKLKFVAIVAAFAVLILIVLTNVFKTTRVSENDLRTYKQGLAYLEKKDFENAFFNFSNVSKNSAIYEIALLRQGLCADELNDSETAVKKYRMFVEKFPDSVFAQKTYYSLAQNYFRTKDYSKAEKVFNGIKKDYKDSDFAIASDYYLGLISKEKNSESYKIKAKEHFSQYLKNAPDGRFAQSCADEILAAQVNLTADDYFLVGRTFFKNGAYKSALENLNKSNIADSWAYLAEINRKQAKYQTYREIFEKYYPIYSKNIDEKDLRIFLENYALTYPAGVKAGWYTLFNLAEKSGAIGADYALYQLTKLETEAVKNELYEKIYKNYPNGKYASDALANLFWTAYKSQKYKTAYKLGQIHVKNYPHTIAAPKILYWMGKLSAQAGRKTEANGFYQRILDDYPDDYYAFRANKQLSINKNNGWKTKSSHKLPEKASQIAFPMKYTKFANDNLSLVNAILKLKDYALLVEFDADNKIIQSYLNYQKGNYSTAALLARDEIAKMEIKPQFGDSVYKLAYQMHYQDAINLYSSEYRLDPYLMIALIREESYFNPDAGSSVGARGLMQLMPATARFIADRNGISYAGSSELTKPSKNIQLGCAYFDFAKEKMYEDDLLAVASYNGGPNAVQVWKDKKDFRNFDEFIENIPYPETRDYVKKVYRSYWVYLNIY